MVRFIKWALFFILIFQLDADFVFAQDPAQVEVVSRVSATATSPNKTVSWIDDLDKIFSKRKSKFFVPLKNAYDNVQNKKFSQALSILKKTAIPDSYKDYQFYIQGLAELGLLKEAYKPKPAVAVAAGDRARKHFQKLIGEDVSSPLERRAVLALAESEILSAELLARNKKVQDARRLFENGFKRYSNRGLLILVPQESIITYAIICEKKPDDVCPIWVNKLADQLDKSEDIKFAKKVAALKAYEKPGKKPTKASTTNQDLLEFQKGYFSFIAGDYNSAYATWYDILKNYPLTNIKVRTKFWMARAADKSKHQAQAITLYKEVIHDAPFSYYALLSYWHCGIEMSRMIAAELPPINREPANISPEGMARLRRAEDFIANGAYDLAALELKDFHYEGMPNEFLVYLAYLNHLAKNHRTVIGIYSELSNRNSNLLFSSLGQKFLFPKTYLNIVEKFADQYKLDPFVPLSIIKQESSFDSDAASFANAYGLMQIIKPTAKSLDANITVPDLFIPESNIRLGVKYIAELLKKYNGSIVLALAAYNAGPHNADRWQREIAADLPLEEYIELISYKETREYVQNILRNRYWYSQMVKGKVYDNLKDLANVTVEVP